MKQRALISGAAGFIGANLARRMLRDGHETHLLIRPTTDRWRIREIEGEAEVHEVDLEDAAGVAVAVERARPEWIFHLAAHGGYSWQSDLDDILRTNVLGTANLLRACLSAGCEAFVNTGSSSEYGLKDHAPTEDEPPEPNSVYAVAKVSATYLCRFLAQREHACLTTLRLYSVYGPYEEPKRFIPTLILAGLEGRLPPLVSPHISRDFVHSEDAVDAYVLAASRSAQEPGAVYNVGTGRQVSIREAVAIAQALFGIDAEPQWGSMEDRAWDTGVWVADASKIRAELGWMPSRSFEEGLSEVAEWLRERTDLRAIYARGAAAQA